MRHPLPTFGSFSFFQASLWLGVNKVLQTLTKSYKNELRHLFQCCILIPRKCPHKTPFQQTVGKLHYRVFFRRLWINPCLHIRLRIQIVILLLRYKRIPWRHGYCKVTKTVRLKIWYEIRIGILLPKLFWPTVRKNCSSDCAKFLRSLEQFIQTVKGQNNVW